MSLWQPVSCPTRMPVSYTHLVQMIVEGVYSAKAGLALSEKYGIDMPIIRAVNQVLFEDMSAADAVKELMLRDRKEEIGADLWEE